MNTSKQMRNPEDQSMQRQAWVWLRLLHSGKARQYDLDGFQRWLRASISHQQAFQAARKEWETLGQAAALQAAQARLEVSPSRNVNGGRRLWLAWIASGATAAVAGAAIVHPPLGLWPAAETWGGDATTVGEQRALDLGDGIQVTLNTQTSIRRQSVDGRVSGIELVKGEAAVDLAGIAGSFTVLAGKARSTSSTGSFEVRNLGDKVCVTCLAGEVVISHPAGQRRLSGRQQAIYDARRISGIGGVQTEQVAAWRRGELRFDQTPLRQVIEEINRYRPGDVVLLNDKVREAPVSGSFYIASLDQALAQLQRTFNLKAKVLPAGIYLLS